MCTSVEVMETTALPSGLQGEAWVRPVFVPTSPAIADASGASGGPSELTCLGWTIVGPGSGLVVDGGGRFRVSPGSNNPGNCEAARAVACCAPVP
jgi:hypothetical protein